MMITYLFQLANPVLQGVGNTGEDYFNRIIPELVSIGLVIGVIVFVLMMAYGFVQWITSRGDPGQLESAKSKVTQAVIGLVVLFSIFAITRILNALLGLDIGHLSTPPPSDDSYIANCSWTGSCGCDCTAYGGYEIDPTVPNNCPGNTDEPACVADTCGCRRIHPFICESTSISSGILPTDGQIVYTLNGSPPNDHSIVRYNIRFYNLDNMSGGVPLAIRFYSGIDYARNCIGNIGAGVCTIENIDPAVESCDCQILDNNTAIFYLNGSEFQRNDLQTGDYPINIQVNGGFELDDGRVSSSTNSCLEQFTISDTQVIPPPVINPATGRSCADICTTDYNRMCGSIGTNATADDRTLYMEDANNADSCILLPYYQGSGCWEIMDPVYIADDPNNPLVCAGNQAEWTGCRCSNGAVLNTVVRDGGGGAIQVYTEKINIANNGYPEWDAGYVNWDGPWGWGTLCPNGCGTGPLDAIASYVLPGRGNYGTVFQTLVRWNASINEDVYYYQEVPLGPDGYPIFAGASWYPIPESVFCQDPLECGSGRVLAYETYILPDYGPYGAVVRVLVREGNQVYSQVADITGIGDLPFFTYEWNGPWDFDGDAGVICHSRSGGGVTPNPCGSGEVQDMNAFVLPNYGTYGTLIQTVARDTGTGPNDTTFWSQRVPLLSDGSPNWNCNNNGTCTWFSQDFPVLCPADNPCDGGELRAIVGYVVPYTYLYGQLPPPTIPPP